MRMSPNCGPNLGSRQDKAAVIRGAVDADAGLVQDGDVGHFALSEAAVAMLQRPWPTAVLIEDGGADTTAEPHTVLSDAAN
ncbi:hypothetical protein [Streptomyces sp. NPDC001652]|uniref:hypothetical protein n=1 Tax=Streptomyces sp. NPDC001652 TaxID=3154393 RepID=UPI00331D17F7